MSQGGHKVQTVVGAQESKKIEDS
eukprot:COSAG02_NODE_58564_length_277_cov_0.573034_1_plen_23_part_10